MPDVDSLDLRIRVNQILNRHPAVGLAVGVVGKGGLELFYGHGLADIASNTPVTEDTVFRIASITKTFTAIAVMQLWEQGLVDLDAPANDYLRAYKLVPAKAGWRPATVRHLLTHTAGISKVVHPSRMLQSGWFGESFKLGQSLPTLGEYYRGNLRLAVEPGTAVMYTDHGFATLGQIVEDVSGEPLHRYFRERIFAPLGMTDSDLVRSQRVESRLATGYRLRSAGARPVTDRQWVTAAASSIYSTPRDMARYLHALLGSGANAHGRVLEPATLAAMFAPHYRPDPRLPGTGLAFFRIGSGEHLAVEHQGVLPGFNSQICLAPDDGVGVMAFTNGTRQATIWLTVEAERLLNDLIGVPEEGVRSDVPHRPDVWGDICGWYQPSAQRTDAQVLSMVGAGAQVFVRRGRLMLRALSPIPALYKGYVLHPDDENDPFVFRIDLSRFDMPAALVVFVREPETGTTSMHIDLIPLSLRRAAPGNQRTWAAGALGALGVAAAAGALRRGRVHE